MTQQSSGFWSSLQGILVGLAAVITAVATLYTAINSGDSNQVTVDNTSHTNQEVVAQNTTQQATQQPAVVEKEPSAGVKEPSAQIKEPSAQTKEPSAQTKEPLRRIKDKLSDQQLASTAKEIKPSLSKLSTKLSEVKKQPNIKLPELVDCSLFPTVNTVRSLMSWSNHYHQQILDAKGVTARAARPCKKTIDYRAQAHCKVPDDVVVRQALFETLKQCEVANIHWKDTVN